MTRPPDPVAPDDGDAPQALLGFRDNAAWEALVSEVGLRLEALDQQPDSESKEQVYALLQGIDAIHREALHRLVRLFKDGVLEKVVTDPAIHTLMELYDLLPATALEPADVDGPGRRKAIPLRVLAGAPGSAPSTSPARPDHVIAHWVPALSSAAELATGACVNRSLDGEAVLLCRTDDAIYALDAQCTIDGAPLAGAGLERYTLVCPRHAGCYYDIRNGARMGGGTGLGCRPVRLDDDGRVLVGFGMPFVAHLPSF